MSTFSNSRRVLLGTAALHFLQVFKVGAEETPSSPLSASFAQLEKTYGGRLGVCALNTYDNAQICYRAEERFPVCSTFKVMLVGAILDHSMKVDGLLQQPISYGKDDLVNYSPITEKHIESGMSVADLCGAAIQYSDNTAANLLMKILGGPTAVTSFARSINDNEFRLDRWETALNTAIPGDSRDTSTPAAMAKSLQALTLGDALPANLQHRLRNWLYGNTTGGKRIRAAVPASWQVGDKTGSGDYGTTNDIALLLPPQRKPIVLTVYYTQEQADAKWQDKIVAAAALVVVQAMG